MQDVFTFLSPYVTSPITWCVFVAGLCIGSFLNVCILRLPEGTFWQSTRSRCPSCSRQIPFWYNIPILSWLYLRGRAACCGAKISIQYPLVEFATALLLVLIYWVLPFLRIEGASLEFDLNQCIRFFHAAIFSCTLLVASVIDIHLKIIPDKINFPLLLATPLVVFLHPDLDWFSAGLGVLIGGGSLYVVAWLYLFLRGEAGLGFGDVKLLAAIGGWLGYQAILPTVMLGSIAGSLLGISCMVAMRQWNMKLALPFGPFLSFGAVSYLLFGQQLNEMLVP